MSTERCYCLPGRCDAIVLFIAHYSISHPCYTIMFNSFEQIKWGGGSAGGGGYWNFCFPFQPLCSLTPVQFYILPARLTHTHAGKKNAHNSRNLHFTLHHACERTSKGSTYRLPHSYEHGQKTIVCFFLHFFFVCCFCISFGRHSIDIYPGRFSDTMRVHLFAQFVCSPSILCLCAHKHKSASAPLLSLEKVPFHLFPPTCLKRGGGGIGI